MKSFILLLKIQLLGLFGINKALHADAAKAKRTLGITVLAVAGIVVLVVWYVTRLAELLVVLGLPEAIPFVAVLVGAVAGAVAAFLKTNGVLFGFKDYDLVMSLPVPTSSVVLSRLVSLYAMSFVFALLVMVPAFAVYAANVGVSAVGIACMALSVVLAPLLPLAVATVLSVLIAAVSTRFKHANIATIVLTLAAMLALVFGSFVLSSRSDDVVALTALGTELTKQLAGVYPPAAWAMAGIVEGDLGGFLAFAAVNLVAAGVVFALVVRLFMPMNSKLMSLRPRGTFSFDGKGGAAAKTRTPLRALVAKEARLLVATPGYLVNSCMGYVLVLIAAVAIAVGTLMGMLSPGALPPALAFYLGAALPWCLAFFFGIASTTTASVSLEGSSHWLMLTAPVPVATVLGAKVALNLLIAVPILIVSATLIAVSLPMDALSCVALFIVPLAACMLAIFGGLALNASRPRYNWTSAHEPVKRSMPVIVMAFGGALFASVGMVATGFLGQLGSLILALVVGAGSIALFRTTVKQGLVG